MSTLIMYFSKRSIFFFYEEAFLYLVLIKRPQVPHTMFPPNSLACLQGASRSRPHSPLQHHGSSLPDNFLPQPGLEKLALFFPQDPFSLPAPCLSNMELQKILTREKTLILLQADPSVRVFTLLSATSLQTGRLTHSLPVNSDLVDEAIKARYRN